MDLDDVWCLVDLGEYVWFCEVGDDADSSSLLWFKIDCLCNCFMFLCFGDFVWKCLKI